MRVHFIAIGGSAMHNLAIALHHKGYNVTGSDDEIFEPSKTRLEKLGLLPKYTGWNPEIITNDIDAIILGMHARNDNPELIRARELDLKIFSYPEYLYEQTKDKIRVVIGGSHGKTTITSMIMHVLKQCGIKFDYMVGALLEGFDTMVNLSNESKIAVFEGDEYLASTLDLRPKFHLYHPNIALISGIAWDHINVFPTFDIYKEQFSKFIDLIEPGGSLVYFSGDENLAEMAVTTQNKIEVSPYSTHSYETINGVSFLLKNNSKIPLQVFGEHNIQNITGAKLVCNKLNISDDYFYAAISTFKGAAKRLQLLAKNDTTNVYLDFAHSPSKLKATIQAAKQQFPGRKLIACMELHTFSSLRADFLKEYAGTMDAADIPVVYFNPETIKHKKLDEITPEQVKQSFKNEKLVVYTDSGNLRSYLKGIDLKNTCLLIMTSGNFSGVNLQEFAKELVG